LKVSYDPTVDALYIRFIEEKVECEVIRLSDRVAVDIGPKGQIAGIEVLDASEVIPDLREKGIHLENIKAAQVG